jgi:hypothetical protein
MNVRQFRGDFVDACGIHAEAPVGRQRFAGNLEQNSFEGRGRCGHSQLPVYASWGVIPKPRAFTSGARDLKTNLPEEILRFA